ncbi:MAG: alpha/beta hydrolase [Acidobacteria bacterium]|nr:alpha/beta hydrolase [Acidobacteriota bacterium]
MKLFIALLPFAALLAQQQEQPPFQLPAGVRAEQNLVYSSPGGRDLHLDLYLPGAGRGLFPAVVYIHGGGWKGGNKNAFRRQAAHMATLGFAGACIQYRLSGEAKYPAALEDSKAAVAWVKANAAKYGIDASRIGAAGGSAGGHLVALLGATGEVQAVAAFNPAVDLVSFGKRAPSSAGNSVAEFIGATYAEKPQVWAEATPLTHVSKKSAPFLFLHGTGDTTVPYQQSVDMLNKLKAAGVAAEIFTAEGAGHGFFNRPPWFEPTLKRMVEFFHKTLQTR